MVQVRLPTVLRDVTGGESSVDVEAATVAEALSALAGRFPGVAASLDAAGGELPRFVNIYLNDEDVRYLEKLETRLDAGDVISILPAVAGGV